MTVKSKNEVVSGHSDAAPCCAGHAHGGAEPTSLAAKSSAQDLTATAVGHITTLFKIEQMDCPTEEGLIRKQLSSMTDVTALSFSLIQRQLSVTHAPDSLGRITDAIRDVGMTPELLVKENGDVAATMGASTSPFPWRLALAGILALGAEAANWASLAEWLAGAAALAAVLLSGVGAFRKGVIALRHATLNINVLMSLAVIGALLLRQWPEAAMVMVLFSVAELIEARSLDRARRAIGGLVNLAPELATVKNAAGIWAEMRAADVPIGSIIRVRPGERIALDGVVVNGQSQINQAPITGESLPVEKGAGDSVYAGTINGTGELDFRVTALANQSTLARITHAVEAAQGARAPSQRFVDRFAKIYTPIVVAIAIIVAMGPPLLLHAAWFGWVYRALVLLVIACPCALVISTPVTIVSGLAAAAKHGILIKGGVYLEEGRKLRWLALDKTGTISHGKPTETDFQSWGDADATQARQIAVSLAARSDHPVSRALVVAGERDEIAPLNVTEFKALPGRGVRGQVDNRTYSLGNHRLIEELKVCSAELEARLELLEAEGKTTLALTDGKSVLAVFAVADTVRAESREAITALKTLGIKIIMLTGDNEHTAAAIARHVGIDEVHGNALPEDKARVVASKSEAGEKIGMVGDGINDALALARADIGFAMGAAGSDTAIETADVALMDDDLRKLPQFFRLSHATNAVLKQNITVALAIKAAFLAITIAGHGTMWMAVFADMGASLLVVLNGLRLLRQ